MQLTQHLAQRSLATVAVIWVLVFSVSCGDEETGFRKVNSRNDRQPYSSEDQRERPVGFDFKNFQSRDHARESSSTAATNQEAPNQQNNVRDADGQDPGKTPNPDSSDSSTTPVPSSIPLPIPSVFPSPIPTPQVLPTPSAQPEEPSLEIQFGQGASMATYISCATMQFQFYRFDGSSIAADQTSRDLGCSNDNSTQKIAMVPLHKETDCVEIALEVRTFRNLKDWGKHGPYWERTLPPSQRSPDFRYFLLRSIIDHNYSGISHSQTHERLQIGYEDLPGPYESTDMDNDDLVIEISFTPGIKLRIPPFHPSCNAQNEHELR